MQTTSALFKQRASSAVRHVTQEFRVSFDKEIDPSVIFFTLDTSILDGPDVLPPSDDNVVQEWDKYLYESFTDRVMGVEWTREQDVPYSVVLAMADIQLNNYDGLFTRGSSPIDPYLLPRRPLRILAGFNSENIPQFVGLSERIPEVDRAARTAKMHATDFLAYLFEKPLDQTVMLTDVSTDEVVDYLLQLFGLTPDQYVLEEGFNIIPFVFWDKGTKLGDAMRQLMEAEIGSIFIDESGVIHFMNRYHEAGDPVMTLDGSNIIDYSLSGESGIINVVEVKAAVREVQELQNVISISSPIYISSVGTTDVFFNFEDPVTEIDDIDSYIANSQEDGSGSDVTADIDVTDTDLFATSVKVTFSNSSGQAAWITELNILGTPARVTKNIYLRVQDEDSIEQFEEQPYSIENNLIQDNDTANSLGLSLLNYYKNYSNTIDIDLKGSPALQIGDRILVQVDDIDEDFSVTKITNVIENGGRYVQRITGRVFNVPSFFTLDESLLDGEDVLAL